MRPALCLLTAAALAAGAAAVADEPAAPAADATPLDTVVVHPPRETLDDSLRLLRLLVEQSAPCLGCDAVLTPERDAPATALLKYLLWPTPPPDVDEGRRLLMDLRTQDDRTLEYLRP